MLNAVRKLLKSVFNLLNPSSNFENLTKLSASPLSSISQLDRKYINDFTPPFSSVENTLNPPISAAHSGVK